jgi:tRNA/tmRNA/rRNA uracil-C5-methylase (TrmA/RlmC/RlmD family)
MANRAVNGVGVDINTLAVTNSARNAQLQGVSNGEIFSQMDLRKWGRRDYLQSVLY